MSLSDEYARAKFWVPKAYLRPARARLYILGSTEQPGVLMTEPFEMLGEWWAEIQASADFLGMQQESLAEGLGKIRSIFGWERHLLFLDTVFGDFTLGALDLKTGVVTPGESAAFVSRVTELHRPRSLRWHMGREFRRLCRMKTPPEPHEEISRAWEVRHIANALMLAVVDRPSPTTWLSLGEAVAREWSGRLSADERQLIAAAAEAREITFREMMVELAAAGAVAAASDLRRNDDFRLGNTPRSADSLVLHELARAFRSRAIRSTQMALGYDRKYDQRVADLPQTLRSTSKTEEQLLERMYLSDRIDALLNAARSDGDAALVRAVIQGDTIAEFARQAGMTPVAARKRWERLKERADTG